MAYICKITDTNGTTGPIGSALYGTCSTASDTVAKVVTLSDFNKLITGVTIHVKFTNSNTATNPTLNVNSTGAKSIYKYGTTVPGTTELTSWPTGAVVSFTYDGSAWIMNDHIDDTDTDTKVTQAYSTTNNAYPVLLSAVAGISSTASRGDQTSIVNNQIYANPSTGRLYANIPEAFLFWGGKDFSGSYGPIDAAMIPTLSANRAAFYPGDRIVVEYTRDGGTTWLDYGADNTTKTALFTTSASFVVGKSTTSNIATPSCKLRITIKNTMGKLYSYIQKIAIYVSTGGSTGCTVDIKGRTRTNVEAESDTWANLKTAVPISGYSGWNILQTSFTTYGNSSNKSSQYDEIQFIFSITSHGSSAAGLSVSKIYMYGGVGWTTPSTLASTGLIYTYDASQNVVFPANITCGGTFIAKADVYTDTLSSGALNMRNSDIYGCNSIKFADLCDNGAEGIQFYRDGTHADSFYGKSGKLYYHPNRAYGSTAGDVYTILHTGNLTITQSLTSGTKIGTITIDGTGIDLYAPSDTDTKVTQTSVGSTYTNYRPLVISAANNATAGFSPSTVTDSTFITAGIYCQPSSSSIFATTFKGDLNGTINTETTATTQTKGNSSTKVATTAFVQTAIGDYIPLSGSDEISGSLKFNKSNAGVYLKDKAGNVYAGINDNGANFWVGASGSDKGHHVGRLYLAAGYDNTELKGFITPYVYTTNADNTAGGSVYPVFHSGNLITGAGLDISLAASSTYSGYVYSIAHTNSVTAVTSTSLLKFQYDAQGHITGSSAITKADITGLGIPDSDTNNHVLQSNTTTANYRPILMGYTNKAASAIDELNTTVTEQAYVNTKLYTQPSTGKLFSDGGYYINESSTSYPVLYEGNMNEIIPSTKYAFVYDISSDFASYAWHKFAEVTVSEANADAIATFLVSQTWKNGGDPTTKTGILTAHIRTSGTKVFSAAHFKWLVAGDSIDPTEFVMVYTDIASTSCKVELWHKQTERYDGWVFKLLKEHSRTSYGSYPWKMYVYTESTHGSATYTAGTGTIVSTTNTIANAITDSLDNQHTMIEQVTRSNSNMVHLAEWNVDGAESTTYKPGISFHNTGGDSTDKGAIILRPYHHNADPWATGHPVGLYIGKGILTLDGTNVSLEGHTHNYAGSSSAGGSATTVQGTLTNPTSETNYPIPFHATVSTAAKTLRNNDGLIYTTKAGTASADGYSIIRVGNGTASGTAGNKYGAVRIYSTGTNYAQIKSSTLTANRTATLPDVDGEIQVSSGQELIYSARTSGTSFTVTVTDLYRKYRVILIEVYGGTGYSWHAVWPLNVIKNVSASEFFGFHVLDTESGSDVNNNFIIQPTDNGFTIMAKSGSFPTSTAVRVYSLI